MRQTIIERCEARGRRMTDQRRVIAQVLELFGVKSKPERKG